MVDGRRTRHRTEGRQETAAIVAALGRQVRAERERRRLTQAAMGRRIGLSRTRLSELERGQGLRAPLDVWVALGLALGRPITISLSRPIDESPADAGHLELQESAMRIARRHGWTATFELPTRPADPAHSIDVCIRDVRAGRLLVLECWNRFGDLGAAARSTSRKLAEAGDLAVAQGAAGALAVHACWLVRPTAANRMLVRRYPELLSSRFTGSSRAWAQALNEGTPPPEEPGIVWFDATLDRAIPIRWRRD